MKFNLIFFIGMSLLVMSFSGQNALGYGGPPEQSSAQTITLWISTLMENRMILENQ